jgi:cytochrome c oxidase subunit 4
MAHGHHEHQEVIPQPVNKAKVNLFLRVTLILFVVTAAEFTIAFTMASGATRTWIFIIMTIVKAYYIVAEFMHLGHEKKSLKASIVLPMLFVVFLIFILIYQSAHGFF